MTKWGRGLAGDEGFRGGSPPRVPHLDPLLTMTITMIACHEHYHHSQLINKEEKY